MTREQFEAKRYLSRAKDLHHQIDIYFSRIEELEARLTNVRVVMQEVKVQSGKKGIDVLGDNVAIFCDKKTKILEKIKRLNKELDEIETIINNATTGAIQNVLLFRYTNFLTWEEIGKKMGFTDRYARKLELKGLTLVYQILHKNGSS